MRRGLDNQAEDKDGRIREKNGASKVKNLAKDYPILGERFRPNQTLTNLRKIYKVDSLDEVLKKVRSGQ